MYVFIGVDIIGVMLMDSKISIFNMLYNYGESVPKPAKKPKKPQLSGNFLRVRPRSHC